MAAPYRRREPDADAQDQAVRLLERGYTQADTAALTRRHLNTVHGYARRLKLSCPDDVAERDFFAWLAARYHLRRLSPDTRKRLVQEFVNE